MSILRGLFGRGVDKGFGINIETLLVKNQCYIKKAQIE